MDTPVLRAWKLAVIVALLLACGFAIAAAVPYVGDPPVERIVAMRNRALADAHDYVSRREAFEAFMGEWKPPVGVSTEQINARGVPGKWFSPQGNATSPSGRVVLYLHGGGFYSGSSNSHRMLAAQLARDAHADVLLIDYRRMPESRYPAQIEDALTAYKWLLSHGYSGQGIALAGESVGGNLAVELALRLRDSQMPMPASLVVMSPVMDLSASSPSMTSNANRDPLLQKAGLLAVSREYLHGVSPADPAASPLFADLHGLPPTLLQVGTGEVLLDDSVRFARAAADHDVSVTLELWPGMVHQWQLFPDDIPDARRALEHGGRFIDAAFQKGRHDQ